MVLFVERGNGLLFTMVGIEFDLAHYLDTLFTIPTNLEQLWQAN